MNRPGASFLRDAPPPWVLVVYTGVQTEIDIQALRQGSGHIRETIGMFLNLFNRPARRPTSSVNFVVATVLAMTLMLAPRISLAQGTPNSFADLAERLSDAVVNISTSQTTTTTRTVPRPNLPKGSPFQEFFDEYFKRNEEGNSRPRRVNSGLRLCYRCLRAGGDQQPCYRRRRRNFCNFQRRHKARGPNCWGRTKKPIWRFWK